MLGLLSVLALAGAGCADPDAGDDGMPMPDPMSENKALVGGYKVVWLKGSHYEMGRQHGLLLADELTDGIAAVEADPILSAIRLLAVDNGLVESAMQHSYPWVLEECRGMADTAGHLGWGVTECLILNYGDVVVEFLLHGMPAAEDLAPGCSQAIAFGEATVDGRLVHARTMDWEKIDFIVENAVVFIKEPEGEVPYMTLGFPGNVSPYQGINAEGISVASNEITPRNTSVNDRTGRSHVQMVGEILSRAASLEDARGIVAETNHMTLETVVVGDGDAGTGAVFEMAPNHVSERGPEAGVVFATNHFVGENNAELDKEPAEDSTLVRFMRLEQLVAPAGTLYGSLDTVGMATVLRDHRDPETGEERSFDEFDDGRSLATNGGIYQLVMVPEAREFWIAAGGVPVALRPFTRFSLDELLRRELPESGPAIIP